MLGIALSGNNSYRGNYQIGSSERLSTCSLSTTTVCRSAIAVPLRFLGERPHHMSPFGVCLRPGFQFHDIWRSQCLERTCSAQKWHKVCSLEVHPRALRSDVLLCASAQSHEVWPIGLTDKAVRTWHGYLQIHQYSSKVKSVRGMLFQLAFCTKKL